MKVFTMNLSSTFINIGQTARELKALTVPCAVCPSTELGRVKEMRGNILVTDRQTDRHQSINMLEVPQTLINMLEVP